MYKINFKDELVKGSIILFVMIALFNFLNYVFQILMNKMLGPSEYGVLAFLMSIMYIFGIPSEAIQTIVSRYTSKFNAKKEYGKIKDLLIRSLKKFIGISIILFILFTIFSFIFISHFFNISIYLLAITGLLIVTSFILPISRGILQGRKKFFALGFNLITDAVLKIIFGVLLVFIGIKAYGGIISLVISTAGAFILSFVFIKEITKAKRVTGEFENIIKYNIPNLFAISCIVLMYSLDIILAKKFFSPEILGQYAFVSLIAKVIIFSNMAIGKAMLPISSENFENGKNTSGIFKKAMIITGIVSFVALLFYGLMPELIIKILSLWDSRNLSVANVLFPLGLAFSFLSFSYIIMMNSISTNKIKRIPFELIFFVILQIACMYIFNYSLLSFSYSIMIVNLLMLIYSSVILILSKT